MFDLKLKRLELDVSVIPSKSFLAVKGRLHLVGKDVTLKVFLHPELSWKKLEARHKSQRLPLEAVECKIPKESFLQEVKRWEIPLHPTLQSLDQICLQVEYSGVIPTSQFEINYIKQTGVELASYAAWYPIVTLSEWITFSITLEGPPNWYWIMNAPRVTGTDKLHWDTQSARRDLTLLGLPVARAIPIKRKRRFWGEIRNFSQFQSIEKGLQRLEKRLKSWLGPCLEDELIIALVARNKGGAYTRQGLLVYPDQLPEEYFTVKSPLLLTAWAHELCHSWFCKTSVSVYDNWIDEALADYCAYIVAGEEFGQTFLETRIASARKQIQEAGNLPPLKTILRSSPKAELVYYKYGVLVLNDICKRIGFPAFKRVVYDFAQKSVHQTTITTEDFLESLNRISGQNWTAYLEERLTTIPSAI